MPNPFGLELGATPGAQIAEYEVTFKSVPKVHPDFRAYSGTWHPEKGLIEVRAQSEMFHSDERGGLARSLYEKIATQLEKVYGPPEVFEHLNSDALYTEEREFLQSLERRERFHFRTWDKARGARLDAGIDLIQLSIFAIDSDSSIVALSYGVETDIDADSQFGAEAL